MMLALSGSPNWGRAIPINQRVPQVTPPYPRSGKVPCPECGCIPRHQHFDRFAHRSRLPRIDGHPSQAKRSQGCTLYLRSLLSDPTIWKWRVSAVFRPPKA
jgi:hypothetical protein